MNLLRQLSDQLAALVEKVSPAVLHIRSMHASHSSRTGFATGSGVLVTRDGLALTNSHVVHGATAVEASRPDGKVVVADVLGEDPATDLAVLRIPATGSLPHAPLAETS